MPSSSFLFLAYEEGGRRHRALAGKKTCLQKRRMGAMGPAQGTFASEEGLNECGAMPVTDISYDKGNRSGLTNHSALLPGT